MQNRKNLDQRGKRRISLDLHFEQYDKIFMAASQSYCSITEYCRRAINTALIRDGLIIHADSDESLILKRKLDFK